MRFFTERLFLTTVTEHDAVDVFTIRSNPEINQFLRRDPPKDTFAALDFILDIKRRSGNNEILFLGIGHRDDRKLIGTICLWKFSDDRKTAELGYELLPDYHGRGIMSEAVNFILNYGFTALNLKQIEAFTNKNNLNSIKLLQKNYFMLNEERRDENFPDNLIFEINRS